ncbi:MAG: flagellar basal body rod protein FlgB [Desulfovibrionaceae bacterium]|nr:flagellar basal body rod protein FlgB [Desulfovibrionaceae bacterium]MDD4953088.1 flagellar basal body rod protein FlgB [Desulfovibrionaceae bacterium]
MRGIQEEHVDLVAKVLDLRLQRQNLVMANITNANTPKYKARRLEFEDRLQSALAQDVRGKVTRTDKNHLPAVFEAEGFKGQGVKDLNPRVVHGEDSVNMEKEVTVLAKNTMLYNALTEVISKSFSGLKKVIQEGNR